MDDKVLSEIRKRAAAATPGPWEQPAYPSGTMVYRLAERDEIASCDRSTDADFIAHARADVPALLVEVERLREFVGMVADFDDTAWCPHCERTPQRPHHPDCQVMKARQLLGEAKQ